MTSLLRSTRQTSSDAQNFVVIGGNNNANGVLVWNQDTTGNGANVTGNFTTLSSFVGGVTGSPYPLLTGLGALSSFSTVGTIYRDMGITLVSSGLNFRKLQFTLPGSASTDVNANLTNGVTNGGNSAGGVAQSGVYPGFLTCYVQLGRNGGTAGLNLARV